MCIRDSAYKAQYYTYLMNGLMTQLVRIEPGNNCLLYTSLKEEGALIRKAVDASLDANVRTPEIQVEGRCV